MAKVINLNRYRKKRAREEKERRAETNRRLHGRTKAERARDEAAKERLERKIDGAFLVRERVPVDETGQSPVLDEELADGTTEPSSEAESSVPPSTDETR